MSVFKINDAVPMASPEHRHRCASPEEAEELDARNFSSKLFSSPASSSSLSISVTTRSRTDPAAANMVLFDNPAKLERFFWFSLQQNLLSILVLLLLLLLLLLLGFAHFEWRRSGYSNRRRSDGCRSGRRCCRGGSSARRSL